MQGSNLLICLMKSRKNQMGLMLFFMLFILFLAPLRSADTAVVTTFDVPGSGTENGQGTYARFMNSAGFITGDYVDPNWITHGYVRAPNGQITKFNAPGAGTATYQGTTPTSINAAGTIAGTYTDANFVYHGFLRAPDGRFTTIDVPGAGTAAYLGTTAFSINDSGVITGYFGGHRRVPWIRSCPQWSVYNL